MSDSEPLNTDSSSNSSSHLISSVLTPAVKLWLKTQVERADDLTIAIASRDRQFIQGYIPSLRVAARQIIYQGLHLGVVEAIATQIRINWWRVVRGQPLQLLEPIPIDVRMQLSEADLNQSLKTDLFADAVADLIGRLLAGPALAHASAVFKPESNPWGSGEPIATEAVDFQVLHVSLQPEVLVLTGQVMRGDRPYPVRLKTGLCLENGQTLQFQNPQLLSDSDDHPNDHQGRSLPDLENVSIDLGDTVQLSTLTLKERSLICEGRILVIP